jgi:hypothetical protein
MGIDFFQTGIGRKFFESDVPKLIKAIERVADALVERKPDGEKRKVWVVVYEDYHGSEDLSVYLNEEAAKADYRETLREGVEDLQSPLKEKGEALLREDKLVAVRQLLSDCACFTRVRLVEKVLQ